MAGGLILMTAALTIMVYAAVDAVRPRRTRTVDTIKQVRANWKRFYGWTYLERPIAGAPAPLSIRLGGFLADLLRVRGFFTLKLEQAGRQISPELFVFWHLSVVFVLGLAGYYLSGPVLALLLVAVAAVGPFAVLPVMAQRHRHTLEEQLSDTLQLIGSLLRAGHGFPQALAAVAKETHPPISLALRKVLSQVKLGGSLEDSLDKMARDVGSVALSWAVTAIKIQREVGGNLSEILDILSLSIRERAELARQVKALTAEGRLSAYILLALPFIIAALLYKTNPAYMSLLWTTMAGLALLGLAITLMIIGSVWLWKLVKVEA